MLLNNTIFCWQWKGVRKLYDSEYKDAIITHFIVHSRLHCETCAQIRALSQSAFVQTRRRERASVVTLRARARHLKTTENIGDAKRSYSNMLCCFHANENLEQQTSAFITRLKALPNDRTLINKAFSLLIQLIGMYAKHLKHGTCLDYFNIVKKKRTILAGVLHVDGNKIALKATFILLLM